MKYIVLLVLLTLINSLAIAGEFYSFIGLGGTYSRLDLKNEANTKTQIVSDFDFSHKINFSYHADKWISELNYLQMNSKVKLPLELSLEEKTAINSDLELNFYSKQKVQLHFGIADMQRAILMQDSLTLTNSTMDITAVSLGAFIEGGASGVGKLRLGLSGKMKVTATEEIETYHALKTHFSIYIPYKKVILGLETSLEQETITLKEFDQKSFKTNIQFVFGF